MPQTNAPRRPSLLLTLQQAAIESGMPYTSLRKLVIDGFLPKVRMGDMNRIWIKRADLEKLIAQSTETIER